MCLPFLLAKDERRASRLSDIVHVSVLSVGWNDARRKQFYRQLLDHIITVSGVTATIADGPLQTTSLKIAANLVKIAELGQAVNANRDDCDKLVQKTSDHVSVISDALGKGNVTIDAAFRSHVLSFVDQLRRIQYVLVNLASRSYWSRLLHNAAEKRGILECQEQLDQAFDRLHLASIVHTAVQLNGIAHSVSDVETLVRRSTEDLRLQLSEVHRVVSTQSNSTLSDTQELQPYPSMIGTLRAKDTRRRRPQRPSSILRISTNIVHASLYRCMSTPYTALPLSPLSMQWTGAAISRARDTGVLSLRTKHTTTSPEVGTREREAGEMLERGQQDVAKIPSPIVFPETLQSQRQQIEVARGDP